MSVLRWPSDGLKKMEDSNYKNFIKKLTDYFKPSGNMFSRLELENPRTREHGRIGCCLLDFLISSTSYVTDVERRGVEPESSVLLNDLLQDVFVYIEEVIGSNSPHDCRFSPTRLSNTACQLYFLFIGTAFFLFIGFKSFGCSMFKKKVDIKRNRYTEDFLKKLFIAMNI